MRKTKIMATVGPASQDIEVLTSLMRQANIIRLNMKHATYEFCDDIIDKVNKLNKKNNTNVAILLDLKGPDITVGKIKNNETTLKTDDIIRIYQDDILGDQTKFSTNYSDFVQEVFIGVILKINDGLVELEVIKKQDDCLLCKVKQGGIIRSHQNIHVLGMRMDMPFLTEKDKEDILYACQKKVDYLALSFTSCGEDILTINDFLIEQNNGHTALIAKIEDELGVENIDEIIKVSDGIMVARGDLGVNLRFERVPSIQKMIVKKCHELGKPSIIATELLATMEQNSRPTRAEVSDVANAVLDGADCVMLSGETTIGKNPALTIEVMDQIIEAAEEDINYYEMLDLAMKTESQNITASLAYSVVDCANHLHCQAVITPTMTGYTAKKISRFRPSCPILALSPDLEVVKNLSLYFGVYAYQTTNISSFGTMTKLCHKEAKKHFSKGKVIITGGYPFSEAKHTNFMHIEEI